MHLSKKQEVRGSRPLIHEVKLSSILGVKKIRSFSEISYQSQQLPSHDAGLDHR